MSIQKQFVLRYRDDGHVRFEIPVQVCQVDVAKQLTDALTDIEGVYHTVLYRRQRKLSIRFDEEICNFHELAHQLAKILNSLENSGELSATGLAIPSTTSWTEKTKSHIKKLSVTRWAREKLTDAQETVQAAKIITRLGIKKPKAFIQDPEKAIIDFFNDILVIFLIRMHWNSITQQWLPKPFKHRYEWMALFYLFFLLVRSRKK